MTTISLERDLGAGRNGFDAIDTSNAQARSLAQAVEAAVNKVNETALREVARLDTAPAVQARALLALLAFCYARQVYSSKTIEAQLQELTSRRFAGDRLPDAAMLQLFRLHNRGPLSFCLKSALSFMAEEKIRQGFVTHVKEAHLVQEARRRIVMAMFTDSLEGEEHVGAKRQSAGWPRRWLQ
ncbi:MAG TPA: hypothetical protein VFE51_04215 [Verrucomicrobiae bacterium]|nr:hypothetical protein [Verrucomicrobiae bacterium]